MHLYGDHKVRKHLPSTDPLLATPNLQNPEQNTEREGVLKECRGPQHQRLCEASSFEWVQLEPTDFLSAQTAWGPSFCNAALGYQLVETGALSTWQGKGPSDVAYVKRLKATLADLPDQDSFSEAALFDGPQERYSFSRTIWVPKEHAFEVLDGTHRMLAVTWALASDGLGFPYLEAMLVK